MLWTNSWAASAQLQLCAIPAVWANHLFLVHASAGIAWEDIPATFNEAVIPPDAVTRLNQNRESLQIASHNLDSTFPECFQVLWHQLEFQAPLSDERCLESYLFNLENNPKVSLAMIEKVSGQSTVSFNNVMEHVSPADAMLNSNKQPTQVTSKRIEGKQGEGVGKGSNDLCCYACREVGHPTCTCAAMQNVLAA